MNMELFDKRFVHFMWDDELEGKEGFFADNIDHLIIDVNANNRISTVSKSDQDYAPFYENGSNWKFFYYDPNYEVKKAFNEGKEIQYRVKGFVDWEDYTNQNPCWDDEDREWRVKPEEEKWIAYLARQKNGLHYLTACCEDRWESVQETYGAKTKLFVGTYDEVVEWYESHQKFTEVIEAWEDGKEIQVKAFTGLWYPASNPTWEVDTEYRVKPEEKEETKDKDKMNPIQEKKMRRYNLNLGDWDELKEMAVKMFKGIAALNERFARKISEGGFVTQDDWKMMNDLWRTFNYTNDDKKICKEDLHHLFTDDLDEEFVEIEAEEAKEKKHYRPYKTAEEFVQDFQERFRINYNLSWSMPSIWIKNKETDARALVSAFREDSVSIDSNPFIIGFEQLFNDYTYLDGSPCGMEAQE